MQLQNFKGKKSGGKCIWDTGSQVQGAVDYHRACVVMHNILRSQYQNQGAQQPGYDEDPDFGCGQLGGGGGNPGA